MPGEVLGGSEFETALVDSPQIRYPNHGKWILSKKWKLAYQVSKRSPESTPKTIRPVYDSKKLENDTGSQHEGGRKKRLASSCHVL
jgi:hypothetical protein